MRLPRSRIGSRDRVFDPLMAPHVRFTPRRIAGLLALGGCLLATLAGAPSALAQCPGAQPACVYVAASQVGQSACGVKTWTTCEPWSPT